MQDSAGLRSSLYDFEQFPQFLVGKKVVTPRQSHHLNTLANSWGSHIISVCFGTDLCDPVKLSELVAEFLQLPHRNLNTAVNNKSLLDKADKEKYVQFVALPFTQSSGKVSIVCAYPSEELYTWATSKFGHNFDFEISALPEILAFIEQHFTESWGHEAREKLYEYSPVNSAKKTVTLGQKVFFYVAPVLLISCFVFSYHKSLVIFALALNAYYLFALCFRMSLTILGHKSVPETEVSRADIEAIDERELPTYTVMVAMYKEAAVLPYLVQNLRELNYPRSKLDIKIILEEDDHETSAVARELRVENFFEFLVVPPSQPKTKPKALNYALPFVKGEFVTIYDAEDRPDPDQLLKAYAIFKRMGNISCVQARLNYFNKDENFLTRMFTVEYSQWFDYFLLGLYRMNIPIPLGGTSNHFRTQVLRDLGGWDPYNVTEDADLGLRLEKNGHRVAIVNSTTFEEANTHLGNWIRQRSRWMKGHMQTFLVHTRNPIKLFADIGPVGFFGFVFFIGAPCVIAILNPLLWFVVTVTSFTSWAHVENYFPTDLRMLLLLNLTFGNILFIAMGAMAVGKRKYWSLLPWCLLLPVYWFLQSVAAYKAVWQLIHKPHFWEKTTHGLSALMKEQNAQAAEILKTSPNQKKAGFFSRKRFK